MSKRPIKKLIENIVKEFTETNKRVSPRLIYLAKLAKHYDTFEKFENDYQMKNFHGIYWHLTTNPNFQINPQQIPTDMSSLAGDSGSIPGLMVTVNLPGWHDTFNRRRQYVAQIDLSDLIPNIDYRSVGRGFGHEIFVFKPEGAKVVKVLPIRQALKQNYDDYRRNLPQNREQLKRIYDLAHGTIQESYIDPSATGDKWKFHVSPLEEKYAVEYIKKRLLPALIKNFNDFRIGKNREYGKYGTRYKGPFNEPITDVVSTIRSLKRINKEYKHMASWMEGYGEFTYEAKAPNGATFEFIIEKSYPHVVRINSLDPWGVGYTGYELKPGGYPGGPIGFDTLIKENIEPLDLRITKEDEHRAIQFIKQKFANEFGPNIGKLLKKYSHTKAESPDESDDIMYDLKAAGKRANFRITRTTKGLWVCRYSEGEKDFYDQCYNLDDKDLGVSIKESAPTGDWQSWEMITKSEKDRLKLVLEDWIAYIHKVYHPHLANTRTYLVQKTINNLDVTDPRFAAKPLAQLSMEDRLGLGDYVDYKDTTGQASKVMDFLLRISRDYIEPPRSPKPDITLKGITRVESPSMKYAGDVTIHGLEDMKPIIGFGYGGYSLSNDFIKEFSKPGAQLWLDMGQNVKAVNMPEVMKRVQDALEKHKQSLTEVRIFDPNRYERTIQSIIQAKRFTKKDEDTIFHHLQNKIVNGERVGKTLKKTHHQITTDSENGDIITYSARPGGKEVFYKAIKLSKYNVRIAYYFNDGNGYDNWTLVLSEMKSPIELTKEDEDSAVQYLKSLIISDERVGKTLRKLGELSPDSMNSSKRAVYAAKIRGVDYNFDIFRSPRHGGLTIVSRPDYKQYTVELGPAKVVYPLTIPKSEV